MKHVILPICEDWPDEAILQGPDPESVQRDFYVIRRAEGNGAEIRFIQGQSVSGFMIGEQTDWYDVVGNIQGYFLRGEMGFQLDVLVDAKKAGIALEVLKEVREAATRIGLMMTIRIFFLGDLRSQWYEEEQRFYNQIKAYQQEQDMKADPVKWNCLYLLLAGDEKQQQLRRKIVPYLLLSDCGSTLHEIRTCGGMIRTLNLDSVESVPMALATKIICAILTKNDTINPLAVLLLADGNLVPKGTQDQLKGLQEKMNQAARVPYPSAMDLLVQKGGPDGDISTTELIKRFFRDNPQSEAALYDKADLKKLENIPWVMEAVEYWEDCVIQHACAAGSMQKIIDQLQPGSEFDNLLGEFQKNSYNSGEKTIEGKDGYSSTAVNKLESCALNIGNTLQDAIFAARIRLIRARMPALRKYLDGVYRKRMQAVRKAMTDIEGEDAIRMMEKWSRKISTALTNEVMGIALPGEREDPAQWIEEKARNLLAGLNEINYEEGRRELAQSGESIMSEMLAEQTRNLIPFSLSGAVDTRIAQEWVVYRQIESQKTTWQTREPVIMRLDEWYMNLSRCDGMDDRLFLREIAAPITDSAPVKIEETFIEPPTDDEEIRPVRVREETLEIYTGQLTWVWRRMDCASARVEIFADRGQGISMDKPSVTTTVQYRPDDRYQIGEENKLPSGVPLLIKVIYQDRGKDVKDVWEEIRKKAPLSRLDVECVSVKEGRILSRKPYVRLVIRSSGAFSPDHIAVASSTGYVYSASWEPWENGWRSELLPDGEAWQVVDRPGDLIEYEIIQ